MNERLKEFRKSIGMTQEKFASKIGLSRNFIAQIELGTKTPSPRTISDICREFHINPEWLLEGKGEPIKDSDINFGEICADIGIHDPEARAAIEKYYYLSDEHKKAFWEIMEKLMK